MDYQNVHLTAAELFGGGHPIHESLIHPGLFASEWCKVRLTAAHAPFDSEAAARMEVHVHRGLPAASLAGYGRNLAQQAHWESSGTHRVKVSHRPLRYRKIQEWPNRGRIDPNSGREKGIDVAVALDVVDAAHNADLVVLASVDTDLVPALEYAKRTGSARIETTSWFAPDIEGGRRQLRTTPVSWNTRLDAAVFRASIDHSHYA